MLFAGREPDGGAMLGHKSTSSFHDMGKLIKVSFAAGVEESINRERIRKETALARNKRQKEWEAKQLEATR